MAPLGNASIQRLHDDRRPGKVTGLFCICYSPFGCLYVKRLSMLLADDAFLTRVGVNRLIARRGWASACVPNARGNELNASVQVLRATGVPQRTAPRTRRSASGTRQRRGAGAGRSDGPGTRWCVHSKREFGAAAGLVAMATARRSHARSLHPPEAT
jgi:hypothetical protein